MAHIQLYRCQNGAYLPVRNVFGGSIYNDHFGLRVYMDGQAYHPTDISESIVDTLSWGDYLEL